MNDFHTPCPVVVMKMEHYGSLGIMRSLGRLGVPVYGIDRNPHPAASVSRFCYRHFVWDLENARPRSTVNFLCDVAKVIGGRPILIPTSDETATLVAENADELSAQYLFPCQRAQLVHSLCCKKAMYSLSRHFAIPTPETIFPRTLEEVNQFSRQASFPVLLKGINGGLLETRTGTKMVMAKDAKQLLEVYNTLEDLQQPNLMIQEYIPRTTNADWMFNGYFNDQSECLIALTGMKVRQNPVHTGMTSFGVCSWNQHLVDTTNYFMKVIGYRGIVDIDYRYDPRSQSYKILDVNPRIGATFRLFVTTNGMDVARAMYLDLTGQTVTPSRARDGRKWIVEDKDLLSSYHYFKDGSLSVREWLTSLRGVEEAGYFAMDDPVPSLQVWKRHVQRRVSFLRNGSTPWQKGIAPAATLKHQRASKRYEEDLYVFGERRELL